LLRPVPVKRGGRKAPCRARDGMGRGRMPWPRLRTILILTPLLTPPGEGAAGKAQGEGKLMVKLASGMGRLGTESAFEVLARAKALEAQGRSISNVGIRHVDLRTPAPR